MKKNVAKKPVKPTKQFNGACEVPNTYRSCMRTKAHDQHWEVFRVG